MTPIAQSVASVQPALLRGRCVANTTKQHWRERSQCVPIRPEFDFYEAGRVAHKELTTPTSRCTTISVSNVRDPENPADRCQTFLVGLRSALDGSLTYTEPVTACGRHQTILVRNAPDNTHHIVLYDIDYLEQSFDVPGLARRALRALAQRCADRG